LGHYRMNATLRVVSPDRFTSWLAAHQKESTQ
jgi:heme/copper-type cytochrome/quinol oxidase subunit 2